MALKLSIDKLEDVAEQLREHYEKRDDGKFWLIGVEDVGGLKSALEKEKEERRLAKQALEKLKNVDPEEYTRLKADFEDRERKAAERKGEYDKLLVQVNEKHATALAERDNQNKALRTALESSLIDSEATRAIAGAKGVPELLLPHVRQSVKVVEEDGKFVAKVVDRAGTPRIGDAKGAPMTIDQLVGEMRESEVFGRAFEGTGASGSGASNKQAGGAGQKQMSRADFNKLDPTGQAAAARDVNLTIVD